MTLSEFDAHFQEYLAMPAVASSDPSMNGVQIACSEKEISHVACAVDACLESASRAADCGADLLFVHHGLFWGQPIPVTGVHRSRLQAFLDNDLALYAAHLPLDMHAELGNNAVMAHKLGLESLEPFGEYKGIVIGWRGRFPRPATIEEIAMTLFGGSEELLGALPFGPETNSTVGIVSGGAPYDVAQAIDQGLDCFITGEASHSIYHNCLEAGINVIFGGHYRTETFGVEAVADYCRTTLGLDATIVDLPTGL
jgi:dinuclear metal center YbgI/SA1388 family protein